MKKPSLFIAYSLLAGLMVALTGCCTTRKPCKPCGPCQNVIFSVQPEDQVVAVSSNATFTVLAVQQPPYTNSISYQWQKNLTTEISPGSTNWVDMAGEIFPSLTITNVQTNNIGHYRARLSNLPDCYSQPAALMTYSLTMGGGAPVIVTGPPVLGGGTLGACPGGYVGYVSFKKPASAGWGWQPMAPPTTYAAADGGGRTDTKVEMTGAYGDNICCPMPSCTAPTTSLPSPRYRFTIYFTTMPVPTGSYPINLTGFYP